MGSHLEFPWKIGYDVGIPRKRGYDLELLGNIE